MVARRVKNYLYRGIPFRVKVTAASIGVRALEYSPFFFYLYNILYETKYSNFASIEKYIFFSGFFENFRTPSLKIYQELAIDF